MFESKVSRFVFRWSKRISLLFLFVGLTNFALNFSCASGFPQDENPFSDFDFDDQPADDSEFDLTDGQSVQSAAPVPAVSTSNATDDSETTSPFATSDVQATQESSPITIIQKDGGAIIFQEGEVQKTTSEMTEDDFYQTTTPAEDVILTPKPETAPELFEAAAKIARTGRPEFAKILLEKSLTVEGTPQEFAEALDRLGSNRVVFLVANPAIGPAGATAVERATNEAKKYWQSPDFVQNGIDRVFSGPTPERANALIDLKKAGDVAVLKIWESLFSDNPNEAERARTLFPLLGDSAADALIVSLEIDDENRRAKIAETLGTLRNSDVLPALLTEYYDPNLTNETTKSALKTALLNQTPDLPSRDQTISLLREKTSQYFEKRIALPAVVAGSTERWIWDDSVQKPVRRTFTEPEAYRFWAANFARRTVALQDETELATNDDFLTALVASAEQLVYDSGLDSEPDTKSFSTLFPNVDAFRLNAAIDFALKTNRPKGGILLVALLAEKGDESFCVGSNQPAVIVRAAICSDRRLRFAALKTIARWNPQRSYIGSSRVLASLVQLTTASGSRKIVVATPKLDDIMRIGNYFISQTPNADSVENPKPAEANSAAEPLEQTTDRQVDATPDSQPEESSDSAVGDGSTRRVSQNDPVPEEKKTFPSLGEVLAKDYSVKPEESQNPSKFKLDLSTENGFVPSPEFVIVPAVDGSDVIKIVQNDADVEFVVANSYIKTPDLRVVAQTLRKDYRTSDVPILIGYEEEARLLWANEYGADEPNAVVLPLPFDSESAQWTVRKLYEKTNPEQVPRDVRLTQSKESAQTLVQFLTTRPDVYLMEDVDSLVRRFISSPVLFDEGLALARRVGTNRTQNFLVDLIGDVRFDVSVRRQFMNAFAENLKTNGSKLRGPDIVKMYNRYNASETEDLETQKILSDTLDAYEAVKK